MYKLIKNRRLTDRVPRWRRWRWGVRRRWAVSRKCRRDNSSIGQSYASTTICPTLLTVPTHVLQSNCKYYYCKTLINLLTVLWVYFVKFFFCEKDKLIGCPHFSITISNTIFLSKYTFFCNLCILVISQKYGLPLILGTLNIQTN